MAMHEHIKYVARLSASAVFSYIKINALGLVSGIIVFIIGFTYMIGTIAVQAGPIDSLVLMFQTKTLSSVLLLAIFLSPILFFILANKYVIAKIVHQLVNDKGDMILVPLLDKILVKFKSSNSGLLSRGGNFALVKMKLIQQAQNESENWLIKKIIVYGMKKIDLNDIDFSKDDQDLTPIIRNKITAALKSMLKPGRKWIWILVAVQWIFLLLIWLLPV